MILFSGRLSGFLIATLAIVVGAAVAMSIPTDRCIDLGMVGRACQAAEIRSAKVTVAGLVTGVLAAVATAVLLRLSNQITQRRHRDHLPNDS
jgi:heme O synthase-like polyprenyltransferase